MRPDRFVFVSSATRDATSTDIADYNAFVQNLANASTLKLGGATWKVLASTETVNAKVNTSTASGTGEAIFLQVSQYAVEMPARIRQHVVGIPGEPVEDMRRGRVGATERKLLAIAVHQVLL
jgi:hypothetical protein